MSPTPHVGLKIRVAALQNPTLREAACTFALRRLPGEPISGTLGGKTGCFSDTVGLVGKAVRVCKQALESVSGVDSYEKRDG